METYTVKARTKRISLWSLLLVALLVGWSAPVFAQGVAEEEESDGLPTRAEDDPMYWAQMRDIYTIQRRAFLKEGRFSISLYGGMIPNNIFEQYFPVGLRANYYVLENIGLEVASSYAFRRRTTLESMVLDSNGIGSNSVLLGDIQVSHSSLGVQWSPVYGKFAFNNTGLFYFDMYVLGGAGIVVVQTESQVNVDAGTTAKPEGVIGAGMAVFMGEHLGLRLDYRQFVFQKLEEIGGAANPSEVSLGVTWFF